MRTVCVFGTDDKACDAIVSGVCTNWRPSSSSVAPSESEHGRPTVKTVTACGDVALEMRSISACDATNDVRDSKADPAGLIFVASVVDEAIADVELARNLFWEVVSCPLTVAVPVCVIVDYETPVKMQVRPHRYDSFVTEYLSLWTTVPVEWHEVSIVECCTAYGTGCQRAVRWTLERAAAVVRCERDSARKTSFLRPARPTPMPLRGRRTVR